MTTWTVDRPQQLTIEEPVTRLDVRLITGRLNVVGTDGPARVEVTRVSSRPVVVDHRRRQCSVSGTNANRVARVPAGGSGSSAPVPRRGHHRRPGRRPGQPHLISGSLVASGLGNGATVNVTSGQITLMGLAGRDQRAKTVSGPIEALGVTGDLTMETVSGEITLADRAADRVQARTISGSVTCDLDNPSQRGPPRHHLRARSPSGCREDADLAVNLNATSGRVTSAFPQVARGRHRPGIRRQRRARRGRGHALGVRGLRRGVAAGPPRTGWTTLRRARRTRP